MFKRRGDESALLSW